MNVSTNNIYKIARIHAGLKREPAAEELHIDVRTLDKYESAGGKAPDEIVKQMCILYRNKYLGYQHLKQSPLGDCLPDLAKDTFKGATLTLVGNVYSINEVLKDIIRIASDGVIHENEADDWNRNRKEMTKLASSLLALLLTPADKGGFNRER